MLINGHLFQKDDSICHSFSSEGGNTTKFVQKESERNFRGVMTAMEGRGKVKNVLTKKERLKIHFKLSFACRLHLTGTCSRAVAFCQHCFLLPMKVTVP